MKSNKESLGSTTEEPRDSSSYNQLQEAAKESSESSPSKLSKKKESRKGNKENRELRILRRSKTLKEKNDPDRFSGEGINFKAKIIGTEHVFDARGNRMCQGALQRLKAAVKTSGDHKQRIILNISLKGIIIKDEKSGEMLHHHPIHKISFISQDVNDNRAFGYVFGCPQTGHEFFGIKTEKIASQVVFTLRDLFLTALEIKKKEIESAIESQKEGDESTSEKAVSNGVESASTSNGAGTTSNGYKRGLRDELMYSNIVSIPDEVESEQEKENSHHTEPAVDNLLDLQFSMDTLQQGISQMDHSIASAATQQFGISFSEDEISESSSSSFFHYKLDKLSSLYQETLSISSRSSSTSDYAASTIENKEFETPKRDLSTIASLANSDPPSCSAIDINLSAPSPLPASDSPLPALHSTLNSSSPASHSSLPGPNDTSPPPNSPLPAPPISQSEPPVVEDKYAVFLDIDQMPSIFDNPALVQVVSNCVSESSVTSEENNKEAESSEDVEVKTSTPIVFAELDPLGNHPYVDKKDFFQDLKTPPKKVLKELVGDSELFPASISGDAAFQEDAKVELFPSSEATGGVKEFNPFAPGSPIPPKLPPKRSMTVVNAFAPFSDSGDDAHWEVKNPFNPFVASDYPDIPPPNSPPPPPPPRHPMKVGGDATPPPRPPSRSNGLPTPPLPKRRSPFANQTWFSFDQDAVQPEPEPAALDQFAPPLPSPARKFPPPKASPSSSRRQSPSAEDLLKRSPRKVLTRHSSLVQPDNKPLFEAVFPAVPEAEPPLPPKRPLQSSSVSSGVSQPSSSNGTRSSSSLVFSSEESGLLGSSGEVLFARSVGDQPDVFTVSSSAQDGLSPDSIFRRKSDPFADDFFLTLPKKRTEKTTNGEVRSEDLKTPT